MRAGLPPRRPARTIRPSPYQGFAVSAGDGRGITLWVAVPTAQGRRELVVSARNLAQSQVIEIAARALAVP